MSRNLIKVSTINIQVGVCNDTPNDGDTFINIGGTITKAGRGGNGGYLDKSDKLLTVEKPYDIVYKLITVQQPLNTIVGVYQTIYIYFE